MTNRDDRRKSIHKKVQEQDLRRQAQIAKQKSIIDRLVTENQIMMGYIGELQPTDERAGQVLEEIERLRAEYREKEKQG